MKIERITAFKLETILTRESEKTLILDCRPLMAFNRQRIANAIHFFCPSILKRRFMTKGYLSLDSLMPPDVRHVLRNGDYTHLVMYDECDREIRSENHDNSDMNIIVQGLKRQSYDLISASVLKGGYRRFKSEFPNLCTVLQTQTAAPGIRSPTGSEHSKTLETKLFRSNWSEPTQLLPHLYIGDEQHSINKEVLHRLGITAILNVSSITSAGHVIAEFNHKVIPVRDNNSENISSWFTEALQFIDSVHQEEGKVLVHCKAGISRSATICIAYLMYHQSKTLEQAFEFVRSKRSIISPNMNFMQQLYEFETVLVRKVRDIIYPKSVLNCSPLPCSKHSESASALTSGYFSFNTVCALTQT